MAGNNGSLKLLKPKIQVIPTDVQGKIREFERNYTLGIKRFLMGRLIADIKIDFNTVISKGGKECVQISMVYGPEKHYLEPIVQKFADHLESKRTDREISGFELEIAKVLSMMREVIDQKTEQLFITVPLKEILNSYNDAKYVMQLVGYTLSHISITPLLGPKVGNN